MNWGRTQFSGNTLVEIMIQISIIILFRVSLKILYAQFYSFYAYDFIIILHLLNTFSYNTAHKTFLTLHSISISILVASS